MNLSSSLIIPYQRRLSRERARILNPEILSESKHELAISIFVLGNIRGLHFNRAEDEVFVPGSYSRAQTPVAVPSIPALGTI